MNYWFQIQINKRNTKKNELSLWGRQEYIELLKLLELDHLKEIFGFNIFFFIYFTEDNLIDNDFFIYETLNIKDFEEMGIKKNDAQLLLICNFLDFILKLFYFSKRMH